MHKRLKTMLARVGGGVTGFSVALPAFADVGGDGRYHAMMWNGGWGSWFWHPLMMLLFVVAVVAVVILLIRWLGDTGAATSQPQRRPADSALGILEPRFARGEIDDEEFRQRKRALEE